VTGRDDARIALLAEREHALTRLAALERDFASSIEAAESANADDEHDPEGATIAFERQHVAALISQAREQLRQVQDALARLADGRYGICVSCDSPIAAQRLAARPAASRCFECAGRAGQGR
jgi:DnaK suppressor protein